MDDLDLTPLSDDQVVALARACCHEAARRSPALQTAMEQMLLSEAEKASIAKTAMATEMEAARARERMRIAEAAKQKARAAVEKEGSPARQAEIAEAAKAARCKTERIIKISKSILHRAASIVDKSPAQICVMISATVYGTRVMINEGCDRYARDHLVDYNIKTGTLKTKQYLVAKKPELAAYCAAVAAEQNVGVFVAGKNFDWSQA